MYQYLKKMVKNKLIPAKVITREKLDNFQNTLAVEKRINALKLKLKEHTTFNHHSIYLILNEILKLRRSQIRGYKLWALTREKGINIDKSTIIFSMGYQYMSSNTLKLIKEEKVSEKAVLDLFFKDKRYRTEPLQSRGIEALISGRIKGQHIRVFNKDELNQLVIGKTKIEEIDKYFDNICNKMNSLYVLCELKRDILKKSKYKRRFVNLINKFDRLKTSLK